VAALSAIAFSIATSVRGEVERTSTALDGVRAYYLASGAIDRALLYMQWSAQFPSPEAAPRYYARWMTALPLRFPTGEALVEIIPENSKLNINTAPEEELFRLLLALGADPDRAREISLAIVDWRTLPQQAGMSLFDQLYLSQAPSFRSRHASFEEIEELLLMKGMTPELFHGAYGRDPQGRLVARGGLKDCVSVYSAGGQIDVNAAQPAVLEAIGLDPGMISSIVQARAQQPFRGQEQMTALGRGGPGTGRLGIGGNSLFTLRSTARLLLPGGKLSDLRRTVAATVKIGGASADPPYTVLRWQDNAWAP
jgi:general secretion pathway protein K